MNNTIERMKHILVTLLSAGAIGEAVTIMELAKELGSGLPCVRNDICILRNLCNKATLGILIDIEILNEDEFSETEITKGIKAGFYDETGISAARDEHTNIAYADLTYGEYNALNQFLGQYNMSEFITSDETGEIFKLCAEYNNYRAINHKAHRKIKEAIKEEKAVSFLYTRSGAEKATETVAQPARLVEYDTFGVEYMVATIDRDKHPEQQYPTGVFRLDRMKNVKMVDPTPGMIVDEAIFDKIKPLWNMDFAGEFDVKFKVYNDNQGKVISKAKRDLKYYVDNVGYKTSFDLDGNMIVEGHVTGKNGFKRFIRTYGASIVILEPQELAQEFIQEALEKQKIYE